MLHLFDLKDYNDAFIENWKDWHRGGPSSRGWTRTGSEIKCRNAKLVSWRTIDVPVDDVLAKNRDEIYRWHLGFLNNPYDFENTPYFQEYLLTRYDKAAAKKRVDVFFSLLSLMRLKHVDPVMVADVANFKLGFRYFRFDGCHRACCAKFLGHKSISARVFSTRELEGTLALE